MSQPHRWWPVLLAAVAALVVGAGGGVLAGGGGGEQSGGEPGYRYAEGACHAVSDWELVGVDLMGLDDLRPVYEGWGVVTSYGNALGSVDHERGEFDELHQATMDAYRSYVRLDQDALTEATDRIIAVCDTLGYHGTDS